MKIIATHRVYDVEKETVFSHQIIKLDEQGEVVQICPFTEEIRQTEWLGGIIILFPDRLPDILPAEDFTHYKERITSFLHTRKERGEKKAYWLSPFNVADMEFTPETHITICK